VRARGAGLGLAATLALVSALLVPALPVPDAAAQAEEGIADVPAGEGRIEGSLLHPDGSARAAGADVILYAVRSGSEPGIRRTRADAQGRFAFEGISTADDVTYLLGARYGGVPFVGRRIEFAPGQSQQQADIEVVERTRRPDRIRVSEASLRVERVGSELVVNEVHRFRNPEDTVFYVTPEEREAGATPAFRAELPAGFTRFVLPYAVVPEGVVREGRDVRFFGPVYPGDQELAFTWAMQAPEARMELPLHLPSGAESLSILTPAGVELASSALSAPEDTEIQGIPYRMLRGGPFAPGARIVLRLKVPPARTDPEALRVSQARAFLEADDAAVQVNEEFYLEVRGDAPVVGTPEEPLLRVPVPPAARDLRYGAEFQQGTTAEDGYLVVRGPVPPGQSRLDLRYRLPVESGDGRATFERRFAADVPVLSVYIADTGLVVDSPRLHRRRPVRTAGERTFLHFEAFRIEPGETVALSLAPLPPRGSASRGVRLVLVTAAAVAVALLLAAPLLRRDARLAPSAGAGDAVRRERDALYESIRDLDHDFETGKLSREDHDQMREELRLRAVALLEQERRERAAAPEPAPTPPASAATSCPACGAPAARDARFCAQCGRALAGDGAPA
jgi:hypothetical protein